MEKLFHPENPVIIFLGRVCDLMLLSVLFTLSCSTIVLAGAAVTALYSMTLKMVRGEEGETAKGFSVLSLEAFYKVYPVPFFFFWTPLFLCLCVLPPLGIYQPFFPMLLRFFR